MLSEEVEDEILALESIYDSLFTRTDVNYIRAVITPAEKDSSIEHDSERTIRASCHMDLPF